MAVTISDDKKLSLGKGILTQAAHGKGPAKAKPKTDTKNGQCYVDALVICGRDKSSCIDLCQGTLT